MLRQRLIGLTLIGLGILIPFVNDGDITVSVLIVPLGGYALFSKNNIID